jgi:hypothetical protein
MGSTDGIFPERLLQLTLQLPGFDHSISSLEIKSIV